MGVNLDYAAFMQAMKGVRPILDVAALGDIRVRAERIAARAKVLAPVGSLAEGDPHPGALQADIGIKREGIDGKGAFVDVGTTEPYGLFVEFGTVNMAAHPFMRPAIAEESGHPGMMLSRISLAPRSRSKK